MSTKTNNATEFVHVASGDQPLYLSQIRRREKSVSLPVSPTVSQMSAAGYEVIQPTERPQGDVVTRGDAVLEDGVWKQTWIVRDYSNEEKNQRLLEARRNTLEEIKRYQVYLLTKGVPYEFAEGTRHIQVKDGDRANIAGLRIAADAAIANGDVEFATAFRVYENSMHILDAAGVIDLSNAALSGYYGILNEVWGLKDLAEAAESIEELPEVPEIPEV